MKKLMWVAFVGIAVAVVKYSTTAGRWHDAVEEQASSDDSAGA